MNHLQQTYVAIGGWFVLFLILVGLLVGLSMIFCGLAVDLVGLALTFSIAPGVAAAFGSVVPFVALHREKIFTPTGGALFGGILLVACGVFLCAIAGRLRERAQAQYRPISSAAVRGLIYAVLSGTTAGLANFGIAFGQAPIAIAESFGTRPSWAQNVIWMPMFLAALVPNVVYCSRLLRRNQTQSRFLAVATTSHWALAATMALVWLASLLLYGFAAARLGELGPVLGWPLFEAIIITTASILGILTGEWKRSGKRPLKLQLSGVGLLIGAIVVFSRMH